MDFLGRKNDCAMETSLENSEVEFISEQAKERKASCPGKRGHVVVQKQKPKMPDMGLVSFQIEYNARKQRANNEFWGISEENQDQDDITRYMKSQDNQLPYKQKKTKDDAIKRWVISQEKHLPLRSRLLDKCQTEDEAQENLADTNNHNHSNERSGIRQKTSSLDYFNMISLINCDLKLGDLKLGGDQPEETPNNQYKGTSKVPKIDGESPSIGKPVQYLPPLTAPSPFDRPKETPLLAGSKTPLVLPAGYNPLELRPDGRTGDHIY